MKLMQHEYPMIAKIEIEMTQEMEMDCLPIKPSKLHIYFKSVHQERTKHYLFSE